ncbi:hypothetical protein SAMN04488570_0932 [Nocardioides scoriae]|uniref:Spheroidene monooxygenase n=1 Tax=Nocardioides scoriae TaxID=642780 RepID=A0A1H1NPV3_9ACTN|nr:monooxygenase [Nocardioides scoriae]SDS00992.1 hypothetical protein SAMN04488570_0932 [Nocardioides scoriae]
MSTVELRVWGVPRTGPALLRMASGRRGLRGLPGLRFAKLLGTGRGRTFTPGDADPHHWALLTVWDDDAALDRRSHGPVVDAWTGASDEELVVRMRPLAIRGLWSGRRPFDGLEVAGPGHDGPVAVLTRARLRPTRALSFWRAVPPVVPDLHDARGLRLALGVGEAPVALQGTFSLWDSADDVVAFAHGSAAHREVVRRTRPERWYAEELFARLAVDSVAGTHRGVAP